MKWELMERRALDAMDKKDIICVFLAMSLHTTTIQVLKSHKTESRVRKIFLPKTVANILAAWKKEQDFNKESLGSEYQDFNLVFANPLGNPIEASTIRGELKTLIEENDLPPVVFHSFRHSSITYKLKLNGGGVKSVQGDSGHGGADQEPGGEYQIIIYEIHRTRQMMVRKGPSAVFLNVSETDGKYIVGLIISCNITIP